MKAKLTLIGAGPGEPDLLTIKGLKALQSADVVLYDSLVNLKILEHAQKAEKIWVGKRKESHSTGQDTINQSIIDLAKKHTHIVRLKGGDPMVFGRAYEEIETALAHGLSVEVIPGISTYSAFAAETLTPITKRNVASGFWVISATNLREELMSDLTYTAQSTSTILIYMGMTKLEEITAIFSEIKPKDYPIGLFQNIGLDNAQQVVGTLENIVRLKKEKNMGTPALIVAGEALKESPLYSLSL